MLGLKLVPVLLPSLSAKYSQNYLIKTIWVKSPFTRSGLNGLPIHSCYFKNFNLMQHGSEKPAFQQTKRFYARRDDECYTEDDVMCHSELRQMLKTQKVVIIDVRNEDETWRTGTIPGSLCIPLHELECALSMDPHRFNEAYCRKKPQKSDHVLFVCQKGPRSFNAVKTSRKMGYSRTQFYQGGFMHWFNEERKRRD